MKRYLVIFSEGGRKYYELLVPQSTGSRRYGRRNVKEV